MLSDSGKFNIAAAQSGGPTAAINASLAGVFRRAAQCPEIGRIYGSINGIEGMINGDLVPLDSILTSDYDVELMKRPPPQSSAHAAISWLNMTPRTARPKPNI